MLQYQVVRETWLTRKIDGRAAAMASFVSLSLFLGGLIYWGGNWQADLWMAATRAEVFEQHQWWRAWTTLFVHADARHLLSNTFLFFILGSFLYGFFGSLAFPVLPLLCGGLINIFVLYGMPADVRLIGVSGVVFWMGGFWLVLYLMIDRRRTWLQRILRAAGAGLGLFMPAEAFDPSISYKSHFAGFAFGVVIGFCYYFIFRRRFRTAEVIEDVIEDDLLVPDA